ncbi:MAG: sialidase family protein [Geminicoccaceae bacterium]
MDGPAHRIVHGDPFAYCAHPHLCRVGGALLVVFNKAPRRGFVLHPPEEPLFANYLTRSDDEGESWSPPVPVPGFGWQGVECAGLTALGGQRVMLNQWQFAWLPLPAARRRPDRERWTMPDRLAAGLAASPEHDWAAPGAPEQLMPWARGDGASRIHLSDDGGDSWTTVAELDTRPFVGGYGMRGAVVLDDGTLVLPLCDIPRYERVFVVRSRDGGMTWEPAIEAAAVPGRLFEEPAPLLLPSGRILLHLRDNASATLWQTWSDDGGSSWAAPEPTGIDGYPAHLLALPDGRLLCTYGFRRPPFAIRAVLSADGGRSWDTAPPLTIRDGLPGKDLGYPGSVTLADGTILTVYYARRDDGTTAVQATRWRLG